MKKSLLTAIVLVYYSCSLLAQQWIDKKYAYDSILNVSYGTGINFNGGIDTLIIDIYLPQCDDMQHISRRPLLMWIHGGAFLAGDKNEMTNLCKQFAKRGYVTATINYRLGFISDDLGWTCNYPNYSCVFAGDSAEWYRAYYRAVQDAKGALRYLINRHSQFRIDTSNLFVAGESAGAITSLGVALLDTAIERLPQTYAIGDLPKPNANTYGCVYNIGKSFPNATVARPDLGDIHGNIEPSNINYTIKGVGNMYGAFLSNLLQYTQVGKPKPAIYSFHQPCDIVVPIDSAKVYWGLSWCMTNGYNCYGIANTAMLYGSRTISDWNTGNNYGYNIHNEFTNVNFPYNFLIGQGSCADQVNNPCHAYDNITLRENNLASFFAPLISTSPICDTTMFPNSISEKDAFSTILIYPNPSFNKTFTISGMANRYSWQVCDIYGNKILEGNQNRINLQSCATGIYLLTVRNESYHKTYKLFVE